MTEIKFSDLAINDLKEIKEYIIEEFLDESAANSVIKKILNSIKNLIDFPESGSPLSSVVNINTNYRFLVSNNYKVFYKYDNNLIIIYRIIYSGRDFMKILFKNNIWL